MKLRPASVPDHIVESRQTRRLRPQAPRRGDLDVDQHHTVEDAGIVLGQLFAKASRSLRASIAPVYFVLPMDETLAVVALDLGGRPRWSTRTG